jgi:GT2 family glycosyltransferase
MPKIAINIVRYQQPLTLLRRCIEAVLKQDMDDFTVTLSENGSTDSIKDQILALFGENPKFFYVDNESNLGFAGAHNLFISRTAAEFVLPLNPDTIMMPGYLRSLAGAFHDDRVAAATGKMLRGAPNSVAPQVLDGTGMVVSKSRRGRERGQLEIDSEQFNRVSEVFGVSATAALYRKSALERVRIAETEFFDADFFAYWEDLDLSWRLRLVGYSCVYVPDAVIYHARAVGQSKGGYRHPLKFIRHHRQFPARILRWNWRNQLFCIIKNDFGWCLWRDLPFIMTRQLFMLGYISLFEVRTLGVVPEFMRLLPKMLRKRKLIQQKRVASSVAIGKWFQ